MLRPFLLDTEPACVENLQFHLARHCHDLVHEIHCFDDPQLALGAILHHQSDVVFLDIEQARLNGFDLTEQLRRLAIDIIFTTASPELALHAFDYEAVGCLLKPIEPMKLRRALERCFCKQKERLLKMQAGVHANGNGCHSLVLHTEEGLIFLRPSDIVHLEAQGSYTKFFLQDGETIVVSKHLGDWEPLLDKNQFFRAHTSHFINLSFVRRFLKKDGGYLVLRDGAVVPVARRRKDELLQKLLDLPQVN